MRSSEASANQFVSPLQTFRGSLVSMSRRVYGDASGRSTFGGSHQLPVPVIRVNEFLPDTQEIGHEEKQNGVRPAILGCNLS